MDILLLDGLRRKCWEIIERYNLDKKKIYFATGNIEIEEEAIESGYKTVDKEHIERDVKKISYFSRCAGPVCNPYTQDISYVLDGCPGPDHY